VAKRKPAAKQNGNGAGRSGRKPGGAAASSQSGKRTARSGSGGKASAAAKPAVRKAASPRPVIEKKAAAPKPRSNHRPVEAKPFAGKPRSKDGVPSHADGQLPAVGNPRADLDDDALRRTNLSEAELAEFRDLLLEKRRELVGDVNNMSDEARRAGAPGGMASSMPIHMADLGSDTWEQELTLGLIENERGLLREIDEALDRIDKKTYGICIATNKPIGKARLRLKPWAKYCIEYARKLELGRA
jgi:DnaK suppressor protein